MRTFDEKSEVTVTARPINTSGILFTPTNARYRVDDLLTRDALIAWTALTPGTSMSIAVAPATNAIINSTLDFETKVVTVETDHGLSSAHPSEYRYRVKNLAFIT